MSRKNNWAEIASLLSLLTQLGIMIVICILSCVYLGIKIDSKINTSPVFSIMFILLGVGSAFVSSYKTLKKYFKKGK